MSMGASPRRERQSRFPGSAWAVAGITLVALHVCLTLISPQFDYGLDTLDRPIALMVGLLVLAGFTYTFAIYLLSQFPSVKRGWWIWMITVGALMRLAMFASTPMLETDFYRYMWDGALVANGIDPYEYSPNEVLAGRAPKNVLELAETSGPILNRINHGKLRTIYPPIAQVAFAAAHFIAPWQIDGLRIVWLFADGATVVLLGALLGALGMNRSWILVYWWNPVLTKEIINSAHMDILILPFLVGALLLVVRGRWFIGVGVLSAAAGIKIWPVLLLPAMLRRTGVGWRKLAAATALFFIVSGILITPLLLGQEIESSGLWAYSSRWEMNDSIFFAVLGAANWITPEHPQTTARIVVMALLVVWIAWQNRVSSVEGFQVCSRVLWIIAALFLLAPAQFPWYSLWMLPILALIRSPGLILLSATLPLYYLRFPMDALGYTGWFDYGIVWLQFGPTLGLLVWEAYRSRLRAAWKRPRAPAETIVIPHRETSKQRRTKQTAV